MRPRTCTRVRMDRIEGDCIRWRPNEVERLEPSVKSPEDIGVVVRSLEKPDVPISFLAIQLFFVPCHENQTTYTRTNVRNAR